MTYVTIDAVRKRYNAEVEALKGIDLTFEQGEFVVIVGPSGCGKSTLLRMIAGLESITSGTIGIDGQIVNTLDPADRGCAMVFQNYALYPHMSVAGNIGYPLKLAKMPQTYLWAIFCSFITSPQSGTAKETMSTTSARITPYSTMFVQSFEGPVLSALGWTDSRNFTRQPRK